MHDDIHIPLLYLKLIMESFKTVNGMEACTTS